MSIIGTLFVRVKEGGSPHAALNAGEFSSAGLMIVATYFLIDYFLPDAWVLNGKEYLVFLLHDFVTHYAHINQTPRH